MRHLTLTLMVLALSAGTAQAAGLTWFGAAPFPAATDPFSPAVAVAPGNDSVMTWLTRDGPASHAIAIASLPAGPGDPSTTAFPRGAGATRDPVVANAPTGDAVVAWVDGPQSLGYSLRRAPGGFAPPAVLTKADANGHDTFSSNVAVAGDGTGTFLLAVGEQIPKLYSGTGGDVTRVLVWSVDASTGLASGPEVVGTQSDASGANPVFEVSLGEAPSGAALLAFYRFEHAVPENDVLVSTRSGGGSSFAPPVVPANGAFDSTQPRAAIDASGRMLLAWRHDAIAGGPTEVRAAEAQPGQGFTPVGPFATGTLSDPFSASGEADLALDAFGRGTVVWQTCFSATACGSADSHRNVLAQRLKADGTLDGAPQTVSGPSPDPFFVNPRLAVAPSGAALLAWQRHVDGHDVLESARRPAATAAFGPDATVPATPDAFGPAPGIDAAGDGVLAWAQKGSWIPHLAREDASPPSPGRITVTGGRPAPFVPLSLRLAPGDSVSNVSVRWNFGDGSRTAPGSSVRHVFRVYGNRTVTATATDTAGFTATARVVLRLGAAPPPRPRFVGKLSASPLRFHAHTTRKHRRGTKLRFRLSTAATVSVRFSRYSAGRRSRGRCVTPTRRLRHAKRCTRLVPLRSGLTTRAKAGRVTLAFSGRLGGKALSPGRYRLTLHARSAHGSATPLTLTVRVLTG